MKRDNELSEMDKAFARLLLASDDVANNALVDQDVLNRDIVDPDAFFQELDALASGTLDDRRKAKLLELLSSSRAHYQYWLVYQSDQHFKARDKSTQGTLGEKNSLSGFAEILASIKGLFTLPVNIGVAAGVIVGFTAALLMVVPSNKQDLTERPVELVMQGPVMPDKKAFKGEVSTGSAEADLSEQTLASEPKRAMVNPLCKPHDGQNICLHDVGSNYELLVYLDDQTMVSALIGERKIVDFMVGHDKHLSLVESGVEGIKISLYKYSIELESIQLDLVGELDYKGKGVPSLVYVAEGQVDYLKSVEGALVRGSFFFD